MWILMAVAVVLAFTSRYAYSFISRLRGKSRYVCSECGATMWSPKRVSDMGCRVAGGLLAMFVCAVYVSMFVTYMWILPLLVLVLDMIVYKLTLKKNCCPKCGGVSCVVPIDSGRYSETDTDVIGSDFHVCHKSKKNRLSLIVLWSVDIFIMIIAALVVFGGVLITGSLLVIEHGGCVLIVVVPVLFGLFLTLARFFLRRVVGGKYMVVRLVLFIGSITAAGLASAHTLVEFSSMRKFLVCQYELVQCQQDLQKVGILRFLSAPVGYLVATNNVVETGQMLDEGIELVDEIADRTEDLGRQSPALEVLERKRNVAKTQGHAFWKALEILLRHSRRVMDYHALWNDEGRRDELYAILGVDSDNAVADKLRKGRTNLDEPLHLSGKIMEHFALWNDNKRMDELRVVFKASSEKAMIDKFMVELERFNKMSRNVLEGQGIYRCGNN